MEMTDEQLRRFAMLLGVPTQEVKDNLGITVRVAEDSLPIAAQEVGPIQQAYAEREAKKLYRQADEAKNLRITQQAGSNELWQALRAHGWINADGAGALWQHTLVRCAETGAQIIVGEERAVGIAAMWEGFPAMKPTQPNVSVPPTGQANASQLSETLRRSSVGSDSDEPTEKNKGKIDLSPSMTDLQKDSLRVSEIRAELIQALERAFERIPIVDIELYLDKAMCDADVRSAANRVLDSYREIQRKNG